MYWIVDVVVVLIFLLLAIYGIKRGFSGSIGSLLGAILALAIGLGGAFALVWFPCRSWGWVDTLGESLHNLLGLDSLTKLFNVPGETIGGYIAMAILGLLMFIVCYLIGWGIIKLLRKFFDWLKEFRLIKVIDSLLGLIIGLAIAVVIVGIVMGVVYMFPETFPLTNETFQAAELSKLLYKLVGKVVGSLGL